MSVFGLITTFFNVDLKTYRKYPSRILFSFFQIFLMAFLFYYISEALGEISFLNAKYFPFVATGLAFQQFFSGTVNAAAEKLDEYRNYGVLEELLFSRFPPWKILISLGFQDIVVTFVRSALLISMVFCFFKINVSLPLLILTLILSLSFALTLSFVASCSFLLWKRFSLLEIGGSLITLFLSGVYFPVEILPSPLGTLAHLNPLLHGLQLFRLSLGIDAPATASMQESVVVLVVATGIMLVNCSLLYRFSLKRIKAYGISAHF